jgi:serine/threonine protein kinase/tetratricopeptide (TPR) repeat protein
MSTQLKKRPSEAELPCSDTASAERAAASPSQLAQTVRVANLVDASVAYKEFCRGRTEGSSGEIAEWSTAFRGRRDYAQVYVDLHEADPATAERVAEGLTSLPSVGTEFLGFWLVAELGQGAFARAYLAQQTELAGRLVVLKVSTEVTDESQTLAQLQHTNIVPIYSIHNIYPFQVVCMPYFGATTLQDIFSGLRSLPKLPESGKGLVSTLNAHKSTVRDSRKRRSTSAAADSPPSGTAEPAPATADVPLQAATQTTLKRLEDFSFVEAVVWMGARLADGLAYAHERGIYHCDLKPANILLTDEGQPMLLDFNLSVDSKIRSNASAALIGGTLPYMSPEQLDAFQGGTRPIDGRSDIFSLGLILFELLTRHAAFPMPAGTLRELIPAMIAQRLQPPPGLRRWNRAVSPAVESIIRHCLEGEPSKRYQSARDLQEDLERFLEHRPLKYAPEPSRLHRARRWVRRHPIVIRSTVALLAGLLLASGAALVAKNQEQKRRLDALDGFREFRHEALPAEYRLVARRQTPALRAQALAECNRCLERYRVVEDSAWQDRPAVRGLPADEAKKLRDGVGVLLVLYLRNLLADLRKDAVADWNEALRLSERAEACFPANEVPRTLWSQRVEIYRGLKNGSESSRYQAHAQEPGPDTIPNHYLEALELQARADWNQARNLLQSITQKVPDHYGAWYAQGRCQAQLGEYSRAAACFTACIALWPEGDGAYFHRAAAYINGDLVREGPLALEDIKQALLLCREPAQIADLYFNRGNINALQGNHLEAINDFSRALDFGAPYTRIFFARAESRRQVGQYDLAQRDHEEGLRRTPTEAQSWTKRGLVKLATQPPDMAGAMADFREALKTDPKNRRAWQNAAAVSMRLGQTEETLRYLSEGARLFPQVWDFWSGRGVQLARLGRREEAYRDAKQALRDAPPRIDYQVAGIYALLSQQTDSERRKAMLLFSAVFGPGSALPRLVAIPAVYEQETRAHWFETVRVAPVALQPGSVIAQAAAMHAVCSQRNAADRRKALALLADALERGFGMKEIEEDPDLNPIRDRLEFRRLVQAIEEFRSALDALRR